MGLSWMGVCPGVQTPDVDPMASVLCRDEEEELYAGARGHRCTCRLETPRSTQSPGWTASTHGDGGGARLRPPCVRAGPCSPWMSYPGIQAPAGAFRGSSAPHLPNHLPGCASRRSKPLQDRAQGPGPLAATQLTQGAQVSIKIEKDPGPDDTLRDYDPSQLWPGAGDVARTPLAAFPARVHLKAEPDSWHQVYTPALGHGVLGAPLHGREQPPFCRPLCACLEPLHSLPGLQHPEPLCMAGCHEHQPPAPGAAPTVKREPLDSPTWAVASRGTESELFPQGAVTTLTPPRAAECPFPS